MIFYDQLNHFIADIEQNLDANIDYKNLTKVVGINSVTLQKVFPLIAGISIADYIRKRRLTLAGKDLAQSDLRITDVALKYGYNSPAAFSRAFYNFHQVKPSEVKRHPQQLKYYPKLVFTKPTIASDLKYEIVHLPAQTLRGLKIISNQDHIKTDAPALFEKVAHEYPYLPHPDFGILAYGNGRDDEENYKYYVLWQKNLAQNHAEFISYHMPAMRCLKFHITSQDGQDIQTVAGSFYECFLPTCNYELRPEPDLEFYHDGITDFLVPIC